MRTVRRCAGARALILSLAAACGKPDAVAREAPSASDSARGVNTLRRPDVVFVGTPPHVVRQMLALADVGPGDTLFDLGSGDGRIVIEGAKRGARGIGIDIDPALVAESQRNAESAGVDDLAEFRHADLFETDLRSATAVTLYLLPQLNVKLRPKLFDELRPGTPVVSHNFPMADWIPDSSLRIRGTQLFVWYIPAEVAGDWDVTVGTGASAERWSMHLAQEFQAVTGRVETGTKVIRLSRARLRGESLSFTLSDSTRRLVSAAIVRGRVRGDTIVATIRDGGWRVGTPLRAVRIR